MTLVMDGVRRTALVTSPMYQPVRRVAPVATPVEQTVSRVGIDGIRRHVPTPREMLAQLQTAELAAVPEVEALPSIRDWRRVRETASFGLIATALLTAGVATGANALHASAQLATPARAASYNVTAPKAPTVSAPAVAPAPVDSGLQTLLNNFVAGQPNVYGIVVKNLTTGEVGTINGDGVIESASMYKLFVAATVYNQIDIGKLSLNQAAGGGSGNTIQGCLNLMITISDNTCGRALRNITGLSNNSSVLNTEGYTNTVLTGDYPQTSANDIAQLFERLYTNTLNSPSSNDAFMSLLKSQRVNNRLPLGLPAGTTIAHKTGDLDGYVHDGGIVYGPKANYLVVVMSGPWSLPGNAPSQFKNLSQQLWNHFEQ